MVALPTPARAAIASIEIASAGVPSASRSRTASMIASSARALRGRPGALRSWSAGNDVVTSDIVAARSDFYQFRTVRRCADRFRRYRGVLGGPAGQPAEHHDQAEP